MKKQVVVIKGGDSFDTYEDYLTYLKDFKLENLDRFREKRWKENMNKDLGEDFDVIVLEMPNSLNAKYLEWKIWFDKFIPLLNEELVLVGHSQGGIFLIKYLSENNFPKKLLGLHVVSAPFDAVGSDGWSLADFILTDSISSLQDKYENISLYQSKDDDIVPFHNIGKYKEKIANAVEYVFEDRGHFSQKSFPELIENIKKDFIPDKNII